MSSRTALVRLVALAAGGLTLAGCGSVQPGVAAKIGSETIAVSYVNAQVEDYLEMARAERTGAFTDDEVARLRRVIVQQLILTELIPETGRRMGVTATPAQIQRAEEQIRNAPGGAPPSGMVTDVATVTAYQDVIADKFGAPLLREELHGTAVASGTDEASLTAGMEDYLGLAEKLSAGVPLTDDDVTRLRELMTTESTLSRLLVETANRLAIQVSQDEVNAVQAALADPRSGVPQDVLADTAVVVTLYERLLTSLAAERFQDELMTTADELGVEVNPRYGQWTSRGVEPGGALVTPAAQPGTGGLPQNQQ